MKPLARMKCVACRKDAPTLPDSEIAALLPQVPDWRVVDINGVKQLERVFILGNFADALAFTNRVGDMAEDEGHHPAILTEWGSVRIRWWTHKIRGLHQNDFVSAAKTDELWNDDSSNV